MTDTKKKKRYEKEFSFSLSSLVDQVSEGLSSIGEVISGEAGSGAPDAEDFHFDEALGDAESADIRVNINRAQCTVRSLAPESEQLLEADLRAVGTVECAVSGGEHKKIRLGTPSGANTNFSWSGWKRNAELPWDVALSPRIPLRLRVNSGIGTNTLLLQELNLRELQLNGGAGKTTVLLPATADPYRARIRSGAGVQQITLADGAQCELNAELGAGKFQLRVGEDCQLQGIISGGAGACEIEMPPGASARVQLRSGLGGLRLPEHFQKLRGHRSGIGNDGVWYSGYDPEDTNQTVAIRLSIHCGVGSVHIRQMEHI